MTKSTIKLNHVCKICNKEIYLPDGTIIHGRPLHFSCWKDECKQSRQAEIIEMIDKLSFRSDRFDDDNNEILMIEARELKQQILEEKKSETEKTNRRKTTYKRIRR